MNPELPRNPREEMELRVTALLLGELSAQDAAAVREAMAKDSELSRLHDGLKETIQLVRAVSANAGEPTIEQPAPLQLSTGRRQKLLTSFVIPPLKLKDRKPKPVFRLGLVELAAVLAILVALAAFFLPALQAPKSRAQYSRSDFGLDAEQLSRRSLGFRRESETATTPPAPQLLSRDNALSEADVGYTVVDPSDRRIVESRVQVSGQVNALTDEAGKDTTVAGRPEAEISDYLKQAQRRLAVAETPVAPPVEPAYGAAQLVPPPTTPPARPQIVLPSVKDADADGLAEVGARLENPIAGGVALFGNGSASTRGLDRSGLDPSAPTEAPVAQRVWSISSESRDYYDRLQIEAQLQDVLSASSTHTAAAGNSALRERYGLGRAIHPSTGLAVESNHDLLTALVTNVTVAGDETHTFGAFKSDTLERGRAGGVEANAGEIVAGTTAAPGQFYRFSLGGGGGGYGGGGGGAGRGDTIAFSETAGKVPVLGDLPTLWRAFRNESQAETLSNGTLAYEPTTRYRQLSQLGAGDAVNFNAGDFETSDGKPGADKLAWFDGKNPRGESTVNLGSVALGLPSNEQKDELLMDSFHLEGSTVAKGAPITAQPPAFGFALADAAGFQVKPSGAGNIVLPATPANEVEELAVGRLAVTRLPRQAASDGGVDAGKTEALLRDSRVLLEAGKAVEAEARLKTVLEADPNSAAARYYLSYAREAQDRAAERRASPSKDALIQAGLAEQRLGESALVAEIDRKKSELEEMRQRLAISDLDAAGTTPSTTLEAASLRPFYGQLVEAQARLEGLNVTAAKSGVVSSKQRKQIELARGEVRKLQQLADKAKQADIEKARKSRPYFDKKRELEQLQGLERTLHTKLMVERDGRAVSPVQPVESDIAVPRKPSTSAPIPQPEIQSSENAFSTFSLNVSDVSFKLAAASLEQGQMPDGATVRSEEFINAFDYRDPEAPPGVPVAFAWERARYPFAHNRDLLRFSLKTAAAGRQAGRPLNVVLLLDNSGSMERADRVHILREALRVLATQLQPQDKLSVITFARTPRLVADGIAGDKAGDVTEQVSGLTPQGGTNLEDAMNLAYDTAARHYLAGGLNRVVLLTDGAANLGNVEPDSLKQKVESQRQQGIALDCFGIGWEGFNDDLLEVLSRNGDGRYGFINSPAKAATEFAGQLAGALQVAASDVKVQVEFNPKRVTSYRQIGYAKHQLTKEQFRDNTVDAAEIAAQEAGNALYTVEVNPAGEGPLGTVRVRYKIPGTTDYREQAWDVPYTGSALSLEQASPALRLAASAGAFAEWLVASPFAGEVTPDRLVGHLSGVPEIYGADERPKKLEWMIRQAKSIEGK